MSYYLRSGQEFCYRLPTSVEVKWGFEALNSVSIFFMVDLVHIHILTLKQWSEERRGRFWVIFCWRAQCPMSLCLRSVHSKRREVFACLFKKNTPKRRNTILGALVGEFAIALNWCPVDRSVIARCYTNDTRHRRVGVCRNLRLNKKKTKKACPNKLLHFYLFAGVFIQKCLRSWIWLKNTNKIIIMHNLI